MKHPFSYLLLSLLCSTAAVQGFAQQQHSSGVRHLDSVVVTGERSRREIIPVQVLSGAALKKLSVYSVADAIRYFSGVQVKDYGGIGGLKTVDVRSLGSHHVKVFYDDIEFSNAQNGVVDLGRFSLDNMEAISLHNGQKSAILQSAKDYASASSVYLTARMPQVTKEKKDLFKATIKAGSFGTINPSGFWEHRWSDKISSAFSAEFLNTSGEYKFRYAKKDGYDTTEKRKNGNVQLFRLEGTVFGKVLNGEWKARLYWYKSERGYPGAAVRELPGLFPNQDRQWDNNFFAQASFRKNISKWYTLQLKTKLAHDYLHYISDPRKDVSTMYINNTYKQQEVYVSAANLFNITNWWSLNAAADLSFNKLDANLVNFAYPRRLSTLAALSSSFTFNRVKLQGSLLGSFVNEEARLANSSAGNKQEYTPSLIFNWQPFYARELHFRAFYKRIFRMPSLNDLYYTQIGNKDLAPEYTTQYNAGFTYTFSGKTGILRRLEPQVDLYFNKVTDKIVAMPTSNQFRWTMMNLGQVQIKGMDISIPASWQLFGQLLLDTRFSYTYQKAQYFVDKTDPFYGGQIPYAPWHSGSAIISPGWKTWSLNYSFVYTGERYSSVANIPENYVKPWYTHDLGLTKLIKKEKKEWRFSAEVNNIFNQQYEVVQWYPMPGINYRLTASTQL
ncbi:TonB-dependent receptor plug domain-containing protein [Pseudobacter ginsenosidimutans]|uniref:Outer membrane cobalamin receptor n=1 Tax=Pseudobacter ginsenosidimutans TaxID=661488 RepID=A0A4Q7N5K4_9BACT|nr:TonB-dependent receptor [Pseudobacter ginsenosidimutans]QEC44839.1 TonB-dependent receptor [Pseudobacter ginsenosidimutans]RZS76331.1 outer membrane cobalamin receptor [Pseudobacter ginsenosidimutans]